MNQNCYICLAPMNVAVECVQCNRHLCSLCGTADQCDVCLLLQLKYPNSMQRHRKFISDQNILKDEIAYKQRPLKEELAILQSTVYYQGDAYQQQYDMNDKLMQMLEENKQLAARITKEQAQLDLEGDQLNEEQIKTIGLNTQNKEADYKIITLEKDLQILKEEVDLKQKQLQQIMNVKKNRQTFASFNHYGANVMPIKTQSKIIQERNEQNAPFCSGKCSLF